MEKIKLEFPFEKYHIFDDGKKHEITIQRLRKYTCDTIEYYNLVFNDQRNPYMMMFALLEEHNGRFYSIKLRDYGEFLTSLNFCECEEMDINIINKDIPLVGEFKDFNEYIACRKYAKQNILRMIKSQKNLSY